MRKTNSCYQAAAITLATLCIAVANCFSETDTPELPHYAFVSGELSTKLKNDVCTIAGCDGKKLILEDRNERLSFTKRVNYHFTPSVALSNEFAEVSEISLNFTSIAANRRNAQMASDNQAIEYGAKYEANKLQAEADYATEQGNEEKAADFQAQADEVLQETSVLLQQTQAMIDEDWFEKEGVFDIYFAAFEITPHQNLKNAFAALIMSFDETDPLLLRQGVKRSIVSVAPLGDLIAGTTKPIKVSKRFIEQNVRGATIDVYLFSGQGMPIATNRSHSLKQLTPEQLKRWSEMETIMPSS